MDNKRQIKAIIRFHHHLVRLGQHVTLEGTAKIWITRFGGLWRQHQSRRSLALLTCSA